MGPLIEQRTPSIVESDTDDPPFPPRLARPCVTYTLADAGHTSPAPGPGEKGTRGALPRGVSDSGQRHRLEGEGRRGTMAHWREIEETVRGATHQLGEH